MYGKKILIVDDSGETCNLIKLAFERGGATVLAASDGMEGLRKLYRHQPDLVLLDVMLPRMSGWDVLRRIRELSTVPVILLTVKDHDRDLLHGFALGADDYVVKPFEPNVLQARVRALLKRAGGEPDADATAVYDDGYLQVDLERRLVRVDGRPTNLTPTEFALLACLLRHSRRVCTYRQIRNKIWGRNGAGSVEAVHAFIWQLRQKIEPDPGDPTYLISERGVGYRFKPLPAG